MHGTTTKPDSTADAIVEQKAFGSRQFGVYLLVAGVLIFGLYIAGAALSQKYLSDIAPQFTINTVVNQKLLFLKHHWPARQPVTLVIGSSMATADFDSDALQQATGHPVLNIGAPGATFPEVQIYYDVAKAVFPVRDVVIVAQFDEVRNTGSRLKIDKNVLEKYITGKMNFLQEFSYRDLWNTIDILSHKQWILKDHHNYNNADFTMTGNVRLDVHGSAINADLWNAHNLGPGDFDATGHCQGCGQSLSNLCQSARSSGHAVTIYIPPITNYIVRTRPDIARRYKWGRRVIEQVAASCGAKVFDVGEHAQFGDACFADYVHMNATGATPATHLFVDWLLGRPLPPFSSVSCPGGDNGPGFPPAPAGEKPA